MEGRTLTEFRVDWDREELHLEAPLISNSRQPRAIAAEVWSLTGTNQILMPDVSNCVTQTPPSESAKSFP